MVQLARVALHPRVRTTLRPPVEISDDLPLDLGADELSNVQLSLLNAGVRSLL